MSIKNRDLHDAGFALHLLKAKSKAPVNNRWSDAPLATWEEIKRGLERDMNLGVRLGKPSEVDGGYLHVIDLDVRMDDEAEDALEALDDMLQGVNIKRLPTVISGSGGESRHFYFVTDKAFRSKKLATSGVQFEDAEGKKHWTWEIELFGTGKQVAMPPSIHPDTGNPYEWLTEPDFMIGIPEIDSEMLDELTQDEEIEYGDGDDEPLGIDIDEAKSYLEKLDIAQWCDDREGWRNVGMALHHEFEGSIEAFEAWCDFSSQSEKYDPRVMRQQWRSFGKNRGRPIRMASIKAEVKDVQIRYELDDDDGPEIADDDFPRAKASEFDDDDDLPEEDEAQDRAPETVSDAKLERQNAKALKEIPAHLLKVPGVLQDVVDVYNASAIRKQPQFAVQTALSLGSLVLGRNYKTNQFNYSSLYFVNLGQTGSGKEHVKTVIEKILIQCNQRDLIGPKSYTSDAGLMSSLLAKPRHLSVSDEFGRYLKSGRNSGDSNKQDAQSALMEVWGRLDGEHLEKGYSTHGMSAEQAEAVHNRRVVRPALTLVGLTTPGSFYDALGDADLTSGFLNRFIVVESHLPRQMAQMVKPVTPSKALETWVKKWVWPMGADDEDMDDVMARLSHNDPGDAVEIPFNAEAFRMLSDIDGDTITMMNDAGSDEMAAMYSRVREIIMRMSLIIAISCGSRTIKAEHVKWCRDYVYFYQNRLVEAIKENIGVNEHELIAKQVASDIADAGDRGMTIREIGRAHRKFLALDSRGRDEVIKRMKEGHGIEFVEIRKKGTRTVVREVYVAT
ncbi:hypothetical protein LOKG_00010 [Loktanella phage pCB2051-A]|uniref:DNA primase/polymerase bifunctional N-terminal domain-containing protein n=1 Tax=Loktanella phage pCB2051-A TaxID=754044 RepID=M4R151_9CAUD|nr:DNA primase [Loktanella phage pCB2051-A]AGH31447.1 hypothetical protein LOKG_00010 [Loktanella phage pCB2051-A]